MGVSGRDSSSPCYDPFNKCYDELDSLCFLRDDVLLCDGSYLHDLERDKRRAGQSKGDESSEGASKWEKHKKLRCDALDRFCRVSCARGRCIESRRYHNEQG